MEKLDPQVIKGKNPCCSPQSVLTDDAQPFLGSGDGYVDLVGVVYKTNMFRHPGAVRFLLNLIAGNGADCGENHVAPLAPWEKINKINLAGKRAVSHDL